MTRINVEEKLFQNRYKVDAGRPHIQIKDGDVCRSQCKTQQCTVCCPAGCYTAEGNGAVTLSMLRRQINNWLEAREQGD